jgi:HAD superfamily hydrolase (TIGR01509 family)
MAYDLIIFDCDGTLVDSEYLNNKVTADLLAELGLPQYNVDYALTHFAGKSMSDIRKFIEVDAEVSLPDTFVMEYAKRVTAGMPDLMKRIPGALETVGALHERVKICVGSNGERSNVLAALSIAGLSSFFPEEFVFTKNMVKNAKPAPDLFLLAADRMGFAPSQTLVAEDSVTGTLAGVAAGMTVVGLTATFHDPVAQAKALKEAGAHYVVERFADIAELL